MKRCSKCKETKSLDSFYVRSLSKKTGDPLYNSSCKDCARVYMKSYRATPESKKRKREYQRERYHSDEEYRKKRLERSARFWKDYPEYAKNQEKKRRENYRKGVYLITNTVTGKIYVGSSVCVDERWRHHKSRLERGIHHSPQLQKDYDAHGKDTFTFKMFRESQADLEELRLQEIEVIKKLILEGVVLYNKAHNEQNKKRKRVVQIVARYL